MTMRSSLPARCVISLHDPGSDSTGAATVAANHTNSGRVDSRLRSQGLSWNRLLHAEIPHLEG
jgi:hypothetical protein